MHNAYQLVIVPNWLIGQHVYVLYTRMYEFMYICLHMGMYVFNFPFLPSSTTGRLIAAIYPPLLTVTTE
jgi:hypothetical protein